MMLCKFVERIWGLAPVSLNEIQKGRRDDYGGLPKLRRSLGNGPVDGEQKICIRGRPRKRD